MDGYLEWTDAELPAGNRSGEMSASFVCSVGGNDSGEWSQIYSYELTY